MQAQEENEHAMRLYDFLVARGGRVVLVKNQGTQKRVQIDSSLSFKSVSKARTERSSAQIDSLFELALQEKAFAALVELEWFVQEQVEEEKNARDILHKVELVKDDPSSLLDLDRELGDRKEEEASGLILLLKSVQPGYQPRADFQNSPLAVRNSPRPISLNLQLNLR